MIKTMMLASAIISVGLILSDCVGGSAVPAPDVSCQVFQFGDEWYVEEVEAGSPVEMRCRR